ncbi:hypothetical protein [Lentibacillus salinarum]|uniref:Uncharacterized protein n=1 Tax=Lentibacillus salinarum TaxID=446820 RepID=A0ABW3ZV94_9BACI
MEKEAVASQTCLDELQTKWLLTDMKSKIIQTACHLIDDEVYTRKDAAYVLLEVVALIELEEKKIHPDDVKN